MGNNCNCFDWCSNHSLGLMTPTKKKKIKWYSEEHDKIIDVRYNDSWSNILSSPKIIHNNKNDYWRN